MLARTFEAAARTAEVREIVARVLRDTTRSVTVPDDLHERVGTLLRDQSDLRWDDAVRIIAEGEDE